MKPLKPLMPSVERAAQHYNDLPMEHDEKTPDCIVCGKPMGMHSIGFVMLRGGYTYLPSHHIEGFAIDPEISLAPTRMPDTSLAIVVDVNPRKRNVFTLHEECAEAAADKLRTF